MPLVVHALLQMVAFMTKQKSVRIFFEWIIICNENIARINEPYFPLLGPNHLQNLLSKWKILNVFWT